mmetsp:Transcript_6553/g.7325  ORF Transcript_6553/g.7325 Transcript_6553/m.7325 type:complete len:210 (-) Transcript_6553:568-1197(-)
MRLNEAFCCPLAPGCNVLSVSARRLGVISPTFDVDSLGVSPPKLSFNFVMLVSETFGDGKFMFLRLRSDSISISNFGSLPRLPAWTRQSDTNKFLSSNIMEWPSPFRVIMLKSVLLSSASAMSCLELMIGDSPVTTSDRRLSSLPRGSDCLPFPFVAELLELFALLLWFSSSSTYLNFFLGIVNVSGMEKKAKTMQTVLKNDMISIGNR